MTNTLHSTQKPNKEVMASVNKTFNILMVILNLLSVMGSINSLNISNVTLSQKSEDETLNFIKLVNKYGRKCVEYDVTTEDGYILKLFNIVGNDLKSVILLHGFLDSGISYILRGDRSIGISLAKRNYSVWIGNFRGNMYSRKHLTLNPDKDKGFWDFSFHEMGYYDLPAMIDFVLNKTGQSKLQAITHSLGTTASYVMSSTRPEYNKKVAISISMAPIAHMQNVKEPASILISAIPALNLLFLLTGNEEIFERTSHKNAIYKLICVVLSIDSKQCGETIQTTLTGYDEDTFAGDFLNTALSYFPSGSSRKTGNHIYQISHNNVFAEYDYWIIKNLFVYGWISPPAYNLDKAQMKFALLVAQNDILSPPSDAKWLLGKLPNVVYYKVLNRKQMNHFDFLSGATAYKYLFPYLFDILDKYQ